MFHKICFLWRQRLWKDWQRHCNPFYWDNLSNRQHLLFYFVCQNNKQDTLGQLTYLPLSWFMQALIWLSFWFCQLERIVIELPLEQDVALVEAITSHATFWCWYLELTRLQELMQFLNLDLSFRWRILLQIFAGFIQLD